MLEFTLFKRPRWLLVMVVLSPKDSLPERLVAGVKEVGGGEEEGERE